MCSEIRSAGLALSAQLRSLVVAKLIDHDTSAVVGYSSSFAMASTTLLTCAIHPAPERAPCRPVSVFAVLLVTVRHGLLQFASVFVFAEGIHYSLLGAFVFVLSL